MALEKEIGEKAKEGAFWGTSGAFLQEGLLLIFGMIMARFIREEEFGLFSTVNIFTNMGSILLQLGLPVALIQRKHLSDAHIKTAYTTTLGLALALFLLMGGLSPWIARWYDKPPLQPVLLVSGLIFLFNAAYGVPGALLTRNFRFKAMTIVSFIAVVIAGTAALVIAARGFGVWGLVANAVGAPAVTCIPLIWLCGWRVRLGFDRRAFTDLAQLGVTVMASNLVLLLSQSTDQLVMGATLGFGLYGYYSRAYGLIILPLQKVSALIDYVAFPAYSKIQDHPELLRKGYLKASLILALITYPMITGLAMIAPEFLQVFYSAAWSGSALPMRILGLATPILVVHMMVGPALVAIGEARAYLVCQIIRLALMVGTVWIGSHWGLAGVCWAVCVGNLIYLFIVQGFVSRFLSLTFSQVLRNLLPAIVLTLIMVAVVGFYRLWMPASIYKHPLLAVLTSFPLGVVTYIAAIKLLPFHEVQAIYSDILGHFKEKMSLFSFAKKA